jgi:hypothetical protein
MRAHPEERLAHLWWVDIPRLLTRVPGVPSHVLQDGSYTRAWPGLAAWLPTGAFFFGLVSGAWHFDPGPTYTFSLILMALMVVIASSGAMVGAWLCTGYAVGDFFLYGHFNLQSDVNYLIVTAFSLLLVYILLALLLVRAVFFANAVARRALAKIKLTALSFVPLQAVLQGVIQGALVWVWVHSVPSLIRPVFTWNGGYPPTDAMRPLQENGTVLVALGAIGGVGRVIAEHFARRKTPPLVSPVAPIRPTRRLTLPPMAKFIFQSCFATFMLSGLLTTWLDAFILAAALFLIRYGSYLLAGRLGPVDKVLARLPLVIRLLAGLTASYFVANWIVTAMWMQTDTFRPVLVSVVVSLLLIVLLMPETRKKQALARRAAVTP